MEKIITTERGKERVNTFGNVEVREVIEPSSTYLDFIKALPPPPTKAEIEAKTDEELKQRLKRLGVVV